MDKQVDGLAGAMRKIAAERDNRLRKAGAISADRVEQLHAFLAAEFPVEMALNAAAQQRDESLSVVEPPLPLAVHSALREQVRSAHVAANRFEVVRHFFAGLQQLSSRRAYQAAALTAVAIIITSVVLHFSGTSKPVSRVVNQSRPSSIVDQGTTFLSGDRIFESSADSLTLRVSRLELASLQPSFFTINRALIELEQPDRVLSLDLPNRQIHLDVDSARTP